MTSYTTDTFFNGRIGIKQNQAGYRFSIDAVLLAYHAGPRSGDKVLDLGTGCGIIPLIMAYRHPDIRICGVEVQAALAELAVSNARENRYDDRITIYCNDMKHLQPDKTAGAVDLVVCNPPYRKQGSGRINPDEQRAIARHELKADLGTVVKTAYRMLRTAGRFVTIYAADRITDILTEMRVDRLEPKYIRMVHSDRHAEAGLVLVEGIKGGRPGLKIAPPLIVYDDKGEYTKEVKKMFRP
jgi:tRNA1Val (adenine37-N6)-methyltransferase